MSETKVDNLILQTPSNDLSNLNDQLIDQTPNDCKEKLRESSRMLAYLANRAISEYPQIRKVLVMARVPRLDSLEKHNEVANELLKEEIEALGNSKIIYCEHNIHLQGLTKEQVFGQPGGRNDGIHCNGSLGERSVRDSFVNVIRSNLITKRSEGNMWRGQKTPSM